MNPGHITDRRLNLQLLSRFVTHSTFAPLSDIGKALPIHLHPPLTFTIYFSAWENLPVSQPSGEICVQAAIDKDMNKFIDCHNFTMKAVTGCSNVVSSEFAAVLCEGPCIDHAKPFGKKQHLHNAMLAICVHAFLPCL